MFTIGEPPGKREDVLSLVKFDLYTPGSDVAGLVETMRGRGFEVFLMDANSVFGDKLERVPFFGRERKWDAWGDAIDKIGATVGKLSTRNVVLLAGKAPLSAFTKLGMRVCRPISIANEFRDAWQLFEYVPPAPVFDNLLQVTITPRARDLPRDPEHRMYCLFFVTMDGRYGISNDDVEQIQHLLHGQKIDVGARVRVGPPEGSGMLPLNGDPKSEDCNYGQIMVEIQEAYRRMFEECKNEMNGVILVSTGPAPVAYAIGCMFLFQLVGPAILLERVQGEYQIAYDTR